MPIGHRGELGGNCQPRKLPTCAKQSTIPNHRAPQHYPKNCMNQKFQAIRSTQRILTKEYVETCQFQQDSESRIIGETDPSSSPAFF